ncbi:MAG: hypothetical protein WC705_00455 [Candidatus Paceibacterota bacterium]|jgi:predicted esterase
MNLDKLLLIFSAFDKDVLKNKVGFKNPLFKKEYFCDNSSEAYILLGPWHANSQTFYLLRDKIINSGYSYIQYDFIPDILSPDIKGTKKYFEYISENIKKDIEEINKKHKIDKFIVMGFSLSCVTASMISGSNKLVKGVILVAPGNTLAEPMWYGLRTASIRKVMEKNKIDLPYLKEQWENLAPEKYAPGLKGKKVKIILSQSDLIIPYSFGKELAQKVKKYVPNIVVKENKHLGHYGTIINFCFISKDISI